LVFIAEDLCNNNQYQRVSLTTFILSRNECQQDHEFKELYHQRGITKELIIAETEETKVKTCKTFDELPGNWKTSEPWKVGFLEAPKCPEKELIIIINTAHKNTENRAILRGYFSGKSFQ